MGWILTALLGMLFFSGMILLFKLLTDKGVSASLLLFFLFLFGALFYFVHILATDASFTVSRSLLFLIAFAAVLSYLGNLLYVKSIALAPNPGYSAAIIGMQLVFITLASVFLFGSELSLQKGVGIFFGLLAIVLLSL